jgi:hypothetical protein
MCSHHGITKENKFKSTILVSRNWHNIYENLSSQRNITGDDLQGQYDIIMHAQKIMDNGILSNPPHDSEYIMVYHLFR